MEILPLLGAHLHRGLAFTIRAANIFHISVDNYFVHYFKIIIPLYVWVQQVTDYDLIAGFRALRHQKQCCTLTIYVFLLPQKPLFCAIFVLLSIILKMLDQCLAWLSIEGENRYSLVTLRNKCVFLKCIGKFTAFYSFRVFVVLFHKGKNAPKSIWL